MFLTQTTHSREPQKTTPTENGRLLYRIMCIFVGCVNSYGEHCRKPCSKHCVNGACDRFNGSCISGCVDGFIGDQCNQGTYFCFINQC